MACASPPYHSFGAERTGVTIPSKFEREEWKDEKKKLYQVNEAAAQYFHNLLLNSSEGEKTRSYITHRGFSAKIVADFQLGFSLNRWNALKASLLLGVIWAIWHLPLYILAGLDPLWITGQLVSLAAIRTLIVFVFNNTGKSVFAVILFHAMYNLCALLVTSFYTATGHLITSTLIVFTALAVTILWDPDTLTQFRFRKVEQAH